MVTYSQLVLLSSIYVQPPLLLLLYLQSLSETLQTFGWFCLKCEYRSVRVVMSTFYLLRIPHSHQCFKEETI